MSFPTESQLQTFHLHPPVLRKNKPLPPLPPPPGVLRTIAASVKAAISKLRWKKQRKGGDIQVGGLQEHESEIDTGSESFITI